MAAFPDFLSELDSHKDVLSPDFRTKLYGLTSKACEEARAIGRLEGSQRFDGIREGLIASHEEAYITWRSTRKFVDAVKRDMAREKLRAIGENPDALEAKIDG